MDKYRDRFEGGIFSTQGKLQLNNGDVYCQAFQINDVQDGNSFGAPFITLVNQNGLKWHYMLPDYYINNSKIDFFSSDLNDVRNSVWELVKKSPNESWLIITKESSEQIISLLPLDWGEDCYPNVTITIDNDDLSIDNESTYIQGNMRYLSSKETIHPLGKLAFFKKNNSINSCLWVISGICESDIRYEIQLNIEG